MFPLKICVENWRAESADQSWPPRACPTFDCSVTFSSMIWLHDQWNKGSEDRTHHKRYMEQILQLKKSLSLILHSDAALKHLQDPHQKWVGYRLLLSKPWGGLVDGMSNSRFYILWFISSHHSNIMKQVLEPRVWSFVWLLPCLMVSRSVGPSIGLSLAHA